MRQNSNILICEKAHECTNEHPVTERRKEKHTVFNQYIDRIWGFTLQVSE